MITVSIVIVSFNTKELIRRCLRSTIADTHGLNSEIIVIDNGSTDGSPLLIEMEFPQIVLIKSSENLGFAGGNNLGFQKAKGEFVILLNSDAFLKPGSLKKALEEMDKKKSAGIGGAKLMAENGFLQPSARMFPTVLNEFLQFSGIADRLRNTSFGNTGEKPRFDHSLPTQCDWVPGAFTIIRKKVLEDIGFFDEDYFLYFEEVDLCRRAKRSGWQVWYWPEIEVIHLGGESSKKLNSLDFSNSGSQLTLWRMRSQFLYHRKNYGALNAYLSFLAEYLWHNIRLFKNRISNPAKSNDSRQTTKLLLQAWKETRGGSISPPRPW